MLEKTLKIKFPIPPVLPFVPSTPFSPFPPLLPLFLPVFISSVLLLITSFWLCSSFVFFLFFTILCISPVALFLSPSHPVPPPFLQTPSPTLASCCLKTLSTTAKIPTRTQVQIHFDLTQSSFSLAIHYFTYLSALAAVTPAYGNRSYLQLHLPLPVPLSGSQLLTPVGIRSTRAKVGELCEQGFVVAMLLCIPTGFHSSPGSTWLEAALGAGQMGGS